MMETYRKYPNLKVVATTLRNAKTATVNDGEPSAIAATVYQAPNAQAGDF